MSSHMDDDDGGENLPDDFFDDIADENFIDDVVEAPNDDEDEADPQMARCLAEIDKLTKHIARRKEKMQHLAESTTIGNEHSRHRSRSPRSRSRDRHHRRRKSRSRSSSKTSKSSRHHSRNDRNDDRNRRQKHRETEQLSPPSRRGRPSRRSRSNSPHHHRAKRSASTHKNLTFLEELAETFKKQGKDFAQAYPEQDLLLNQNASTSTNAMHTHGGAHMDLPFAPTAPFNQPQQPVINPAAFVPQQPVAYPIPQNVSFYGVNPMNINLPNVINPPLQPMPPIEPTFPILNPPNEPLNKNAQVPQLSDGNLLANNQIALIDRCEQAIKLIRAKENKVPIMKFQFNRTSTVLASNSKESQSQSVNKTPLVPHSVFNAAFQLNATVRDSLIKKVNGLKLLPSRVKGVATALNISSSHLFEKMQTKEINAQITEQILSTINEEPKSKAMPGASVPSAQVASSSIETANIETQTDPFDCKSCKERKTPMMVNQHSQTFAKTISIGVQTNEKDYREPIVELLATMTAAQLVAIKDFANIIVEPRPQSSVEMYKVRERMTDIYNLSQRDADAVRADENRLNDFQYAEQMRYRASNDPFSREFDQRSNSPRFGNGNVSNAGDNFDNNMLNEREMLQREFRREEEERQRIFEERERARIRQMERDMDVEQRLYTQRMLQEEEERERMEREHHSRQLANQQGPFQQQQMRDDEMRFQNDRERSAQRGKNTFNAMNRGAMNRRGRGAFRENFRGRGNRR